MENSPTYPKKPLWQWLIIYLIIGGLVYTAIYYAFLKPKTNVLTPTSLPVTAPSTTPSGTTSALTPTNNSFTITAKSVGFQPQTLTIKAGDAVSWVNEGNKNIFIASSPHPSHTDYPPLNLGIIRPTESKSLIFPKAGTYKFHDHLDASHFGNITVK